MEISFSTNKLEKLLTSESKMRGEFGPEMSKKIQARLLDMDAAGCLAEMHNLPGRCHELKGNRAGQFAVDLKHPMRLIFRPDHEPIPVKEDGGIDWSNVTKITVVEIDDYH